MAKLKLLFIIGLLSGCAETASIAPPVKTGERHIGYYYPKPAAVETYKARAKVLPAASRERRLGFVVGLVNSHLKRPYPLQVAMFAKGDEAQKLIIVSTQAGRLDTIYRVRAYLATLTSVARTLPLFRDNGLEDILTFLDLARMLGFERITISDGHTFAHQIRLK